MKNTNLIQITKNELSEINGGGLKEAFFTALHYTIKYSSITGAFLTGIVEGYYDENN
jgi:hypothetical protein